MTNPQKFIAPYTELKRSLRNAFISYLDDDNDADVRISSENATSKNAKRFINSFPSTLPMPEICIEEDGEVSFDWMNGKGRHVSVSVGPGPYLRYAALINGDSYHARELLTENFSSTIHLYISKILPK
ncbi:MAG: hypothetical protein A2487_15315 [Candidatus Raymondbacteria bacterium RifOxyC12_full_50_8]|uniref:Uncharacterized protein n=1 Tax=Candidatus Raymondbacteria bacterium RIFOXYD12_FULL_49_13 TaxID=1817890 RepID=A0A1F7FGY0_UNCRA|nr:MAG: hypothetical protein A2248_05040 [Candidatus Raymondbacteria bacterium RIFOXYA2_FULL_49_16]OGJ94519.1 MAG: hypothetical protein A2487_15315 [Candidatus Raymondbacteria bacterium RifOxyC12_full_50_8]OGJ99269.1 MAG: hypothetical protein A2350_05340 [Candidatus Raymondbacteria bacterium RifOxyB12_full_50_8]OGK05861.1 MAG: hypothetical protein A2519_04215 [Candidatus Raymondbacteria bacterium RIFOXYD12_FULL_49_13]OGP43355.1 MAG: hypothetical protein A2324_02680 [Candidatus Raymondbacteria b